MRQYKQVLVLASACRALGSLALDPACQAQLAGKDAYQLVVVAMGQNEDEARLQEYAATHSGAWRFWPITDREQLMTCCCPQTYVAVSKHGADPGVQARACWFLGNLALEVVCRAFLVQDSRRRPLGYLVGALQRHRSSAAVVASACVGLANLALDANSHGLLADGGVRLAIEAAQGHGEDAHVQVAAWRFISSLADSSSARDGGLAGTTWSSRA
jgi:hypothetical protein